MPKTIAEFMDFAAKEIKFSEYKERIREHLKTDPAALPLIQDIVRMKPNTANLTVGETLPKSGLVRVWLKSGEGFWLDGKDEVFVVKNNNRQ